MEDAGFIIGAYAVTFSSIAAFAWWVRVQGRRIARRVPDDAKPWV